MLEEAATEGPWTHGGGEVYNPNTGQLVFRDGYKTDSEFIVTLRNAAKTLIEDLNRLEKENEELKAFQAWAEKNFG